MIPSTWRRYQLSQLINKALSLVSPIPFDFLISGDLLRTSIHDWCSEHGIAEEETLNIEYIQSVLPPQKTSELPHDDWVSAVSSKFPGFFLTASYDGYLRAFDYSQQTVIEQLVHQGPITSLCVIPVESQEAATRLIATSSLDLTCRISKVGLTNNEHSFDPQASLHLHTAPVSSISCNASGTQLLTSSWDSLIGLFDTTIPDVDEIDLEQEEGTTRKKRRKLGSEPTRGKRKAPISVLKSHTARVSKAVFGGENSAVSCGFDSTVRAWDLDHGVCTNTITSSDKAFLDLVCPSGNSAITASMDRSINLFDFRSSSTIASALSLKQVSTPSCLAVSPVYGQAEQQVVSGGYDGAARIWDLRSTKLPVATFFGWEDAGDKKILGVDWTKDVIALGGERGMAIWRVSGDRKSVV